MVQSMARLANATGSVERASEAYEQLYRNALQTGVSVSESGAGRLPGVHRRSRRGGERLDLPSIADGTTHLFDVTVPGARQANRAEASLSSATRFIELDALAWSNSTVRVMVRNISGAAFDLDAATLSVAVTKRRIP